MASIANQGALDWLFVDGDQEGNLSVQAVLTAVYCAGALLVPVPASQRGVRAAGIVSQKGVALPICK